MKYFAYGSNMDEAQMKERCPSAIFVGAAYAPGYRLAFSIYSPKRKCGCADIIQSPRGEVWGVIYEVSEDDMERLDNYEGSPRAYRRMRVQVQTTDGEDLVCESYEVVKKREGLKPSGAYLSLMKNAAERFEFPVSYRHLLEQTATID